MLKVNDKVKVIEDLQADVKYDGIYFHKLMLRFKGKVVTIGNISHIDKKSFNILEDTEGYLWSEGMF